MKSLSIEQVAGATGGSTAGDISRVSVSAVTTDSRQAGGKDLFFALTGTRFDGHSFLDMARRNGARAAVVAARNPLALDFARRFPQYPLVRVSDTLVALGDLAALTRSQLDIEVVGIAGTTGKTSTKDFLVSILALERSVAYTRGNYNNEIGLPLTVFSVKKKDEVLVAEMGARRPGDIKRLCEIAEPDTGIVTNIGPGHLEIFKTMEAVARTKGELGRYLPDKGRLLLNASDPYARRMARETKATVIRFGRGKGADYVARVISLDDRARAVFELHGPGIDLKVTLPVIGRHQVENALAAAACAHVMGSSPEAIVDGLRSSKLSRWRTECVDSEGGFLVINDSYNANPSSMEAALRTLTEAGAGRRTVAVLGGMEELGASSRDYHLEAGGKAAELDVDIIVTVGRKARDIAVGAGQAGLPKGSVFRCEDPAECLRVLGCVLEPGDVVLVKASRASGLEAVSDALASPAFGNRKLVANV